MDFNFLSQKLEQTANNFNPVVDKVVDGLIHNDTQFAQFDAEMRPVMEHDAQSFDLVVTSKRRNQVKSQFKLLKEQAPPDLPRS